MFFTIREKIRLWRLEADLNRLTAQHQAAVKASIKEKKSGDEIDGLRYGGDFEIDDTAEVISELRTQQLLRKAKKYDLIIPDHGDERFWTQGGIYGEWLLTPRGRNHLRANVIQAQKDWRDGLTWWVPLVFGLIGALTGLTSILLKK